MVQEGVDGVLERNRAAGESNNPTHEGAPSPGVAANAGSSSLPCGRDSSGQAIIDKSCRSNRRFAAEHDGEAEPSGVATSPSHRHEVP